MIEKNVVINAIYEAFGSSEYPGDDYLIGSKEGREPFEEIEPFKGQQDWTAVKPELLDRHYAALSFFSEAGLRFFLPAYLIADLNDELKTADPLFVLTHGFSNVSFKQRIESRVFVRKTGKTVFVNPNRYGAMTFYDYSRYQLSIFNREEAQAIVLYLEYKLENDPYGVDKEQIEAALNSFWLDRVEKAPTAESIARHLFEEAEYLAALMSEFDENG
jgi:hypothetical protein